jgi:hypothetical protein
MIVSVSRRTDVPAFYTDWFFHRLEAGRVRVPNPFNPNQVAEVDLRPQAVDCFVFWSKNPAPLLDRLDELDASHPRYYFLFTLNHYPAELEPGLPPVDRRLDLFRRLAGRLGPERVVWRYDPIVLSNRTDADFHRRTFQRLSKEVAGSTDRVIVSLISFYAKTRRRLAALAPDHLFDQQAAERPETDALLSDLADMAAGRGMAMTACAAGRDIAHLGLTPGRCVDADLVNRLWNLNYPTQKHKGQRPDCGCAVSRDIGVNNTCLHHCAYCYAVTSPQAAKANYLRHDPRAETLIPTK